VILDWENNAKWWKVSNKYYLIGPVINTVQTLMSFSDSGHFFISDRVYFELDSDDLTKIDNDSVKIDFPKLPGTISSPDPDSTCRWPNLDNWWSNELKNTECIFKKFTFYDAEKLKYILHSLHVQNFNIGSSDIPNYQVNIEYRDRRQSTDPRQLFIQHLVKADEVAIIGLTHENTVEFLKKALEIRKNKFWTKLDIIFPSCSVLEQIIDHRDSSTRLQMWQNGKWTIFQFLRYKSLNADRWQCKEFDHNLPFIANRFISNSNKSIRFSPQLPGCDQKNSYYIEVFEGMPVYDELNRAFDLILTRSVSINEWLIYGQLDGSYSRLNDERAKFNYYGIINRNKMQEKAEKDGLWFPIVLVLLYINNTNTGFRSILQERSVYNADSNILAFAHFRLRD
jgi:hypothetical protein